MADTRAAGRRGEVLSGKEDFVLAFTESMVRTILLFLEQGGAPEEWSS
jgi:hypothetical protein